MSAIQLPNVMPRARVAVEAKTYFYKIFRVRGRDGGETTCSMDFVSYLNALARHKLSAEEFVIKVREAAHLVAAEQEPLLKKQKFSPRIQAVLKSVLEKNLTPAQLEILAERKA